MELRHLRYFVAVAETLHFGRAAGRLGIAQPSLSHQIRQLEADLQTELLQRTNRRVALTDAGRLFLDDAREIIARADRAALIARRVGCTDAPCLRVAVGYCMNQSELAGCLGDFQAAHKGVQVQFKTMTVPAQLDALSAGRLDVGLVRPPISDPALESAQLLNERLVVALPPKHPLRRRRSVPIHALANEPFVFLSRDAVPVLHDVMLRACRHAGFVPHAPHEVDHLQMVLAMVAAGGGVSLVPARAREIGADRVIYRPLLQPEIRIETRVAWRRDDVSPVTTAFVQLLRNQFGGGPDQRRRDSR